MSGGVDSAVAAARAVDAGHDVIGVHLALSRKPATLRTGAAAAARSRTRGTPAAPPTCSASRSTSGTSPSGSARTWSTTSSPSTRRPHARTRACAATRRSSSPRCSSGRSRSASTPCAPATTRSSSTGPTGASCTAPSTTAKDQSYVLGVLDRRAAGPRAVPARGRRRRRRCAPRPRERGLTVAEKPDSHDICFIPDGDTAGWLARRLGAARRATSSTRSGAVVGAHDGRVRVHRRPAARARARPSRPRRPAALRAVSVDAASNRVVGRHRPSCWGSASSRERTALVRAGPGGARCGSEPRCGPTGSRGARDRGGRPAADAVRVVLDERAARCRTGAVGRPLRGHPGGRVGDHQRHRARLTSARGRHPGCRPAA